MVLVFDLDDTLYNEITYVQSGFRAVSEYLFNHHKINKESSYNMMMNELEMNGRGRIFNEILKKNGILSKSEIIKCIRIYRTHKPIISLNKESIDCLDRFSHYHKYIVTDGNKVVQKNKISALGLKNKVKKVFITHNFGIKHSKPSPYCFHKIQCLENTDPKNIIYIGDNPNKDFVNIKKKGFKTIRLINGMFKDLYLSPEYEADIEVNSLDEITLKLVNNL